MKLEQVVIGGIRTSTLSRSALCKLVIDDVRTQRPSSRHQLLFDINGQGLAMSRWDWRYRQDLMSADFIHADGQPLVIASRLLTTTPIAERSATTDLFNDISAAAASLGVSFYLLGGSEDVNAKCARILSQSFPGLRVVGRRNGYFTSDEEAEICESINSSGADILWVGLGKPAEQSFCVRNRHNLEPRWIITCGGCFNFITGSYRRAPQWIQDIGFEWMHRMFTRPRQLAWRYLTTSPVALYLLLTQTRESR